MLFELINPSDHYTFLAPDLEIAAVLTVILGDGQYGAKQLDAAPGTESVEVPLMLFGGGLAWFRETLGIPLDEAILKCVNVRRDELVAALRSVLAGNRNAYDKLIEHVPESEHAKFAQTWHTEHCTSMNDIGKRARAWAYTLEKKSPPGADLEAPRQVFTW